MLIHRGRCRENGRVSASIAIKCCVLISMQCLYPTRYQKSMSCSSGVLRRLRTIHMRQLSNNQSVHSRPTCKAWAIRKWPSQPRRARAMRWDRVARRCRASASTASTLLAVTSPDAQCLCHDHTFSELLCSMLSSSSRDFPISAAVDMAQKTVESCSISRSVTSDSSVVCEFDLHQADEGSKQSSPLNILGKK